MGQTLSPVETTAFHFNLQINFNFSIYFQFQSADAGCSGAHDLPIQISNPHTQSFVGKVAYVAPDVHSLANQLMRDIPVITFAYANVIAEDAFYIEENVEITYEFVIAKGNAEISRFKIKSTTLGDNKVNMEWYIFKAREADV